MMQQELKERLIAFFESCHSYKGKHIHVREYISTRKDNFDRHFTTFSELDFKVENFGVRISGGRAMFIGANQSYEIGADMLIVFEEIEKDVFELIERYSENVYRKSVIKFC